MWQIAMVALVLTAGGSTLLPFTAVHVDTGQPMVTWADYLEAPNMCVVTDGSLEPGVDAALPGCVWVVAWIRPDPTGVPELPEPERPSGGCGDRWLPVLW
jgi:hypothetical protein